MKMPTDNTYRPQYPPEWDEKEQEDPIYHWMIDNETECDGRMFSYYSRTEGDSIRTTYYCEECGKEYKDEHVVQILEERERAMALFKDSNPGLHEAMKNLMSLKL